MTTFQKKLIRRATMAAAVVGLLVPVSVSPNQGIDANDACASGTCCREMMSACIIDGQTTTHHYQSSNGTCGSTEVQ